MEEYFQGVWERGFAPLPWWFWTVMLPGWCLFVWAHLESWTWLEALNKLLLQWFFVRLARVLGEGKSPYSRRRSFDRIRLAWPKATRWTVLRWVVPMTGWSSDYRFIGKRRR